MTIDTDNLDKLVKAVKAKDFQSLAKLLSLLDRNGTDVLQHSKELLKPKKTALKIGITGPPGAGKSTLIGKLIESLRKKDLTVGVIAVDPSSPFSKGAILGDRIRYSDHFNDEKVFIRSLGTRGSLGGLSSSAYLMLRAFDLAEFDIVLIETVGVGQTELEVVNVADKIGVVLVPESGDSIQAIKAGLLEIADYYIVNKSDRPGAEGFTNEIKASGGFENNKDFKVINTVATEGTGIEELTQLILDDKASTKTLNINHLKSEAKSILRSQVESKINKKVDTIVTEEDFLKVISQGL